MKKLSKFQKLSVVMLAIASAGYSAAATANEGFIADSRTDVNVRYRLEGVDQDGKTEEALASTLKARLTWSSGQVEGFAVNAELDHVLTIGPDDYNDASGVDPKTQYPVVADPTGTDFNQLNVDYVRDNLKIVAGRQRIVLGDQRFVGGVAWRQNEQTYDGVRAVYKTNDQLKFDYSYVAQINRIFGPDGNKAVAEGSFHLFNTHFKIDDSHDVTGFAYLLDYDSGFENNTYGIDYVGKLEGVKLHAAFAVQSTADFDTNYFALDATKALGKTKITLGYERLGSDDGQYGFTTPLATAHKFQGFADKFLGTPNAGVNDYFVKVAGTVSGVKLAGFYHNFTAVEGDSELGSEFDLVASYKATKNISILAKYAYYMADDHATDTSKFWLMANAKF